MLQATRYHLSGTTNWILCTSSGRLPRSPVESRDNRCPDGAVPAREAEAEDEAELEAEEEAAAVVYWCTVLLYGERETAAATADLADEILEAVSCSSSKAEADQAA